MKCVPERDYAGSSELEVFLFAKPGNIVLSFREFVDILECLVIASYHALIHLEVNPCNQAFLITSARVYGKDCNFNEYVKKYGYYSQPNIASSIIFDMLDYDWYHPCHDCSFSSLIHKSYIQYICNIQAKQKCTTTTGAVAVRLQCPFLNVLDCIINEFQS